MGFSQFGNILNQQNMRLIGNYKRRPKFNPYAGKLNLNTERKTVIPYTLGREATPYLSPDEIEQLYFYAISLIIFVGVIVAL